MNNIKSEDPVIYMDQNNRPDNDVIANALSILKSRLRQPGQALTDPNDTAAYLKLKLAEYEHEVFCCLWLDNRHQVIEFVEMFRGTIDGASVHPREVVKAGLSYNAAAVIFAHNHPSGTPEPSQADRQLTSRLKDALAVIDIRALDHFVIGGMDHISFSERGFL